MTATVEGFPRQLQPLLQPRAYSHAVEVVTLIETHISWVLLTGEFAYKIKRPVHFSFIDLRSMAHRAYLCAEEIRLNRRFAPDIYLQVCEITESDGETRMGGSGRVIEHAVKMRQFSADDELDRLLCAARIEPGELAGFGRDLARIHEQLPVAEPTGDWGQPAATRALILENLDECARLESAVGAPTDVPALGALLRARLDAAGECMLQRLQGGRVRECHGDLHCGNIARQGSRLVAFDCIEFDARLRWIDVADEVAFLLADLDSRGCSRHAQAFLDAYLRQSGDYQACRLIDLYKAHRALVRAKVIGLGVANASAAPVVGNTVLERQRALLECARRALSPKRPMLVLMCGLSGSGKTWVACRLASCLEAIHLRSDIERKRLAGLGERTHSGAGGAPGEGLYTSEFSARVYRHLARSARDILSGGLTAIVDATFHGRAERLAFRELGRELGVPLCVVHCRAPHELLQARLAERNRRDEDASEADAAVLSWQETQFEPITAAECLTVIELETAHLDSIEGVEAAISRSPKA